MQKTKRKKIRFGGTFITVLAVLVMFSLMAYKIYCDASYNEKAAKLSALDEEYEELLNREKQLNISLAAKADLRLVEDIAVNQLGMSKLEQHQIEYVSLDSADKAVVIENDDNGVFADLFKNFSVVWEYFR